MNRHAFFDKWGVQIMVGIGADSAKVVSLRLFIDDLDALVDYYLKEGAKTAHIEFAPIRKAR